MRIYPESRQRKYAAGYDREERTVLSIIEAQDIVKRFNGFTAVDGISFRVVPGEFFGYPAIGTMKGRLVK